MDYEYLKREKLDQIKDIVFGIEGTTYDHINDNYILSGETKQKVIEEIIKEDFDIPMPKWGRVKVSTVLDYITKHKLIAKSI